MQVNQRLFKNILILVILSLLVVPFIFTMFGLDKEVYESFSTYSKSADDVSMTVLAYKNGGNTNYAYCVNGDISCGANATLTNIPTTDSSYTSHFTDGSVDISMYTCNLAGGSSEDMANIKCENSAFQSGYTTGTNKNLTFFTFTDAGDVCHNSINSILEQNSNQNGFTIPYATSVLFPLSFDGKYAVHNDISYSICPLFEKIGDCYAKRNTASEDSSSSDDEDVDTGSVEKTSFRCVADYGAQPGDDLCCGQTGVVQNNSDTCPHEYPKCYGYKCGEKWGVCGKK